jgi:hypothetical protein
MSTLRLDPMDRAGPYGRVAMGSKWGSLVLFPCRDTDEWNSDS